MIYIEELNTKVSREEESLVGRKLLLKSLQIEYGISELPEISFGNYGKPFFKAYPDIHFNISHCNKAVVCSLSDKPIGIDVECINPLDEELAQYVCSPQELDFILKNRKPAIAFTVLWTKKESYLKLTGEGLPSRQKIQNILNGISVHFSTLVNESKGYAITSCTNSSQEL